MQADVTQAVTLLGGTHLMEDWFADAVTAENGVKVMELMIRLWIAFGFGIMAAAIHHFTCSQPATKIDRSFLTTLVLLSVLIALVTQVIGSSIARAFSLAGALAIVRFRTVVEDTRDTAFVIFAVVSGMAAGTGFAEGPLICAPMVALTAWVLRVRRTDGGPVQGSLVLRLAVGRPPDGRIETLLAQHLTSHRLVGLTTARGGSALDATYNIVMPPADKALALVNELGRVEGVQGVELKGV